MKIIAFIKNGNACAGDECKKFLGGDESKRPKKHRLCSFFRPKVPVSYQYVQLRIQGRLDLLALPWIYQYVPVKRCLTDAHSLLRRRYTASNGFRIENTSHTRFWCPVYTNKVLLCWVPSPSFLCFRCL